MQIKQSKTLRSVLSRCIVESAGGPAVHPADRAFAVLLDEANCHASHILHKVLKDWEIYQIKMRMQKEIAAAAPGGQCSPVEVSRLNRALESICAECAGKGQPVVNTGHLLLYTLRRSDLRCSRLLDLYNVSEEAVKDYVRQLPAEEDYYIDMRALQNMRSMRIESGAESSPRNGDYSEEDAEPTAPRPSEGNPETGLEKYGINLTRMAARGEIDPVVGREKEIERLVQILGRRKKNNPILIGEAGVGKSAIVEGLALRIAARQVPPALRGKMLFSLDVTSLVAGTKYRGQFEERIKGLLKELKRSKNMILFIDEIHTIVGAGSTQGSLDTANILKPALARGELQCIGATTLDEFRENIERDSALERRFQKIIVEPTSREETLAILHNIKGHYEQHHCVSYSDEAVEACVELSERYITDRNFPDKAIDVLDEAGSRAHVFETSEPDDIAALEKALDEAGEQKRQAVASLVYEQAAQARLREIAISTKLSERRAEWQKAIRSNPTVITVEHIQDIVSSMTGIPVQKVSQGEKSRLRNMLSNLEKSVVGQNEAIDKVTKSIQRSRTGLKDPGKPIGVFMFVGPTGVGKTLLAKELSRWLFDRSDALVRIDMSEYSERHNISRLIGSPPGYVGYNEGGQLTEIVRRQPYAVVLFDEIEKAHPDVFNIMLQIFDEGHLTDGLGRTVDFRNTVIIMTSNVGSRDAVNNQCHAIGYTTDEYEDAQECQSVCYRDALESTFAPEFINRIDDVVIFNTLSEDHVRDIVRLELNGLNVRAKTMGYELNVTDGACGKLAELGYDSRYGVRSLKRVILEKVEEPMAQMIVSEELRPGDSLDIDLCNGEIRLLAKAV